MLPSEPARRIIRKEYIQFFYEALFIDWRVPVLMVQKNLIPLGIKQIMFYFYTNLYCNILSLSGQNPDGIDISLL